MKKFSISETDSILQAIKEMDRIIETEKEEDSIKLEKGSKKLEINKKGKVKGSMPLHNFEHHNADNMEIGDNKIKVNFEKGTYIFNF